MYNVHVQCTCTMYVEHSTKYPQPSYLPKEIDILRPRVLLTRGVAIKIRVNPCALLDSPFCSSYVRLSILFSQYDFPLLHVVLGIRTCTCTYILRLCCCWLLAVGCLAYWSSHAREARYYIVEHIARGFYKYKLK